MLDPLVLNEKILSDVEGKTGRCFRSISGVDSRDKAIAEAVLPVLRDWVPHTVTAPNIRHALFSRFITPHAYPHMNWIMQQWETEQDSLCEGALIQALALIVKPPDAVRLWALCRRLISDDRLSPYFFLLLPRLAKFPPIAMEVKETVVKLIQHRSPSEAVASELAKIDDPGILTWLERHSSSHPHVRTILKRMAARGKRLPPGIAFSATIPDRREEVFSTEDDVSQVSAVLGGLAKRIGVKIPTVLGRGSFLSSVEPNRWLQAPILSKDGRNLSLRFRLEDVDVVEIVVTESKDKPSAQN